MALYVKVFTAFYSNRKTARLRSMIGDDAFWLPPRLWAYAADNQPDGNFSGYTPAELAMLVGYSKDACSMLEALQTAGFMDGMALHDWQKHNSYHSVYADRAKTAAEARWSAHKEKKQKKEKIREERIGDKHCNKHASSMEEVISFVESLGLPLSDGEACWHKWIGNGWTNGGKPIKNWQATIRSWKASGYMPSQKPKAGSNGSGHVVNKRIPRPE